MTPEFSRILAGAFQGGIDVSLRQLVIALGLSEDDVLGSCIEVRVVLDSMSLTLQPEITRGDFDLRRALISSAPAAIQKLHEILEDDERQDVELKSTLVCDLRAYREEPSRHERSDGVTHSALKTICAFANSGGGILLVGVEDNKDICGLGPDYAVMGSNRDRWENHFRSLISDRFWQGRLMNSFVGIEYIEVDEKEVALVRVIGRSESTFLRRHRENKNEFFVRQGNRTVSLDLPEFELWLRSR